MKLRKLVALIIALTFCVSCFAGCTDKVSKNSDGVPEVIWYTRCTNSRDFEEVLAKVNEYIEPKIGAKLKIIPAEWGEYNQKLQMAIAADEDFDMCLTGFSDNYHKYVQDGVFMDIEDILKKHGKETYEQTKSYAFDAARVDGKLYGIPFIKEYAQEYALWYRKDLAEKYGFDMESVKTLEDLEPMLKTIKENEEGFYGFETPRSDFFMNLFMFDQIGTGAVINYNGDTTKVVNPFETKEVKQTLETFHKFYKKGYIRPQGTAENMTQWGSPDFLKIWEYLPNLETSVNMISDYERGILHIKEAPTIATGNATAVMISINSHAKNPEKAIELLNLINTDGYLRNLLTHGIEGKHWIADGENNYKYPEGCKTADDTGYSSSGMTVGSKAIMRQASGTPDTYWEDLMEFDEKAELSPALGFAFDSSKVKTELAAIQNAYDKYIPSLITGYADPDEVLDETNKKLRDAGLDKYLAEIQSQYDQWRKTNKK